MVPAWANPQSLNRFTYTYNNPTKFIDPSGHRTCTAREAEQDYETCDQNVNNSAQDGSSIPTTYWTNPYCDPVYAVSCGSLEAGVTFESMPYSSLDDLPSDGKMPAARMVRLLEGLGILKGLAEPHANLEYLKAAQSGQPNVNVVLYYAYYAEGLRVPAVSIRNGSDMPISVMVKMESAYLYGGEFGSEVLGRGVRQDFHIRHPFTPPDGSTSYSFPNSLSLTVSVSIVGYPSDGTVRSAILRFELPGLFTGREPRVLP